MGSAVGKIIQLDRNRDDPIRVGVCRREHQAIQSVIQIAEVSFQHQHFIVAIQVCQACRPRRCQRSLTRLDADCHSLVVIERRIIGVEVICQRYGIAVSDAERHGIATIQRLSSRHPDIWRIINGINGNAGRRSRNISTAAAATVATIVDGDGNGVIIRQVTGAAIPAVEILVGNVGQVVQLAVDLSD